MNPISSLAGLLSLCGITSVRMFAPTFLYGFICRFLPTFEWCPAGIVELAENCPAFLTGDFGLFVFGALGILEVVSNWEDSIRELLTETNFEQYAKPVFAMLAAYEICTPEQMQVLSAVMESASEVAPVVEVQTITNVVEAVQPDVVASAGTDAETFSWSALLASLFCGMSSFGFCRIRANVLSAIRELDPDNTLYLNSLATIFEENFWLGIFFVALVFPVLALFLMMFMGLFGWVLSRPLKKLAQARRAHWDSLGKDATLRSVTNRAVIIFAAGAFLSVIPVFGYLATVLALNFFVFGVMSLYEKTGYRLLVKIVLRFVKLTVFLIALLFAGIPFLGILLLVPYGVSFALRLNKLRAMDWPARTS